MSKDDKAIAEAVQLYIDGFATGDISKLKEGFHDDARMYGHIEGKRYDVPITALFDLAAAMPGDTGKYNAKITSIHQTGDAATATVEETGCWGDVSFTDYFALTRIDGAWKMASKTFAHTGGKMPG